MDADRHDRRPLGLIAGTGVSRLFSAEPAVPVATPYGEVFVRRSSQEGVPLVLVARHGGGHSLLPHEVNYLGNLWALHALGVRRVFATSACGSVLPGIPTGSLVVIADFLDFTSRRPRSFRGAEMPADPSFFHVSLEPPHCPAMAQALRDAAAGAGLGDLPPVVYACTEGPRYETPAEIRMFARMGADVVGMTGVPEAPLARELGLCYCSLGIVTNPAAGTSGGPVDHGEVEGQVALALEKVADLLRRAVEKVAGSEEGCCGASARRRKWFGG